MAIYRGSTKLAGIGKSFNPENSGCEGQVLTKTDTGYAYCDAQSGNDGPTIDLIVVGGGGGGSSGGGSGFGGGGGGGGVIECRKLKISGDSFNIIVGTGGSGAGCSAGCNGGDSCAFGVCGLGGGGGGSPCTNSCMGCNGGNGGGAGGAGANITLGGAGLRGGFSGGIYRGGNAAGGGGGAGGPGGQGQYCYDYYGGAGGQGYNSEIFCTNCFFGTGGGGGSGYCIESYPGGGRGGPDAWATGGSWYGGGGGGTGGKNNIVGRSGFQGVVMLRYKTNGDDGINCATGGTVTTSGDYTYHQFTSNGTFCIVC